MKLKQKLGSIPLPSWFFLILVVCYNEWLLHFWITDPILPGRLVAVTAFALGFGGLLAFPVSLIPSPKAAKWTAVGMGVLVSAFWVTEYFVSDAYRVFMTPKLMLGGAGGVAQDYFDLVVSLVTRNWWRIALVLLPNVLYALFCRCRKTGRKIRSLLAALALVCYGLGMGAVFGISGDGDLLVRAYNFDSAVRTFGLNMALALETVNSNVETGPAFEEFSVETEPRPTETVSESVPEETVEETQPEYSDNVIEALDFETLAETEKGNRYVAQMHRYVAGLTPTKKNAYTGLFEGKNLILITAEAFTAPVIDPERTPTLYRMANEGIKFHEYYQPAWGASTTSGEFSNVMGIVPLTSGMLMKDVVYQHYFLTMGHQLQRLGYYSTAYHNHVYDFYERHRTHTHLGYDRFIAQYAGMEGVDKVGPESDLQMIDSTVPDYIGNQPFSIYYMTVSGHCMYSQNENYQAKKNYDLVADLDYSEPVKCYHAANLELEKAMASLVAQLEEAGIADDTVVVISSDHYPYGLENSATWKNSVNYLRELYGVDKVDNFVRDSNALIIWSGCLEDMDLEVTEPVYSLDVLPTLSNLFGVEYDSRLLVGRDVFSGAKPLVLWPDYSWKTDLGTYHAASKTFTPNPGVQIPEDYAERITKEVINKVTYSHSVQKYDYFNSLSKVLGYRE